MLQFIRDRATGWIAWFIIILICVPFALWGIQEYVSPQGSLTVAEVNNSEIGYYQFQSAYQTQRQQLERMLGQRINNADMERQVRDQTLERLINEELLVQTVVDSGLRVGDGQLAEAIRNLPVFRDENGFTQEDYDGFLRARGLSAQGFELDMRRTLLGEQLISAVQRSELVTRGETQRLWSIRNRTRHYRQMVIDPTSVRVDEPDDSAITSYFEAHSEEYVQPEQVKIAYIEIARDSIANQVPVDEQELRAIYERNKGNYRTAEQREAGHILVQVPRDAEDSTVAEAKKKIDSIRARIVNGEEFAAVAKEVSDDPGSASSGGSLGFFGRGVMDPAFEEAAFSLDKGVLSEPVRSSFGWHLIQVTEIQPEKIRGFDEVRESVGEEYRRAEAEQLFAERVEELANLSFEHPESLDVAAEALGVTPQVSEFFSRSGEEGAQGIALNPRVRNAAFSAEVKSEGNNSELLELGTGRVAVIRLLERRESRPLSLEEAKDRVREALLAQARSAKATALGETIVAALKDGANLDEVASAHGQAFQDPATASPAQPGVLSSVAQRALFSMPTPPSEAKPAVVGLEADEGSYEILALLKVEDAAAAPSDEQDKEVRTELEAALGAASFRAMMQGLRKRAEVRIFEDTLRADSL